MIPYLGARHSAPEEYPLHHFPDLIDKVEFNGKNIIRRIEVICIAPFSYLGGMQGVNKTRDINQMGVACMKMFLINTFLKTSSDT